MTSPTVLLAFVLKPSAWHISMISLIDRTGKELDEKKTRILHTYTLIIIFFFRNATSEENVQYDKKNELK